MHIVFFGTFNPVTNAHIKIASKASKVFNNAEVIFVPVSDSYSKNSLNTSFNDRVNMLRLAIKNHPNFIIEEIEENYFKKENRQLKSIETLRLLKEKYNDELAFLIGTDNYFDLPNWYKVNDLLTEFIPIIYPRTNEFNKTDLVLYEKYKNRFIFLDNMELVLMSSTLVRENLTKGLDVSNMLDKDVLKYIKEKGIKF